MAKVTLGYEYLIRIANLEQEILSELEVIVCLLGIFNL